MTTALTADRIVAAWETGAQRAPLDRAIALLWAFGAAAGAEDLPLAERDRQLLRLRQATFGPTLAAVADCPDCGTRVEIELKTGDMADALVAPESGEIEAGGAQVTLRPMTSRDLAAASDLANDEIPAFLRRRLSDTGDDLPTTAAQALEALIEERETGAELMVALTCPDCTTQWREPLDVAAHVWSDVEISAYRILGDVAEIAAAFGWSEAEILAMNSIRRAAYLRIARGG